MSDVRTMLAETVARLHTDLVSPEVLARAEAGEFPHRLWTALEENGLTSVLATDPDGGVGGTWEQAFVLLEAAGRWSTPAPLAEAIVAGALLRDAKLEIPAGVLTIGPAREGEPLRLASGSAGTTVDGVLTGIPWARYAAHVVAAATSDTGPAMVVVPIRGARIEPASNVAGEPRDTVVFDQTGVDASAPLTDAQGLVRRYGALARATQLAGGITRLLELSVAYAGERKQFGRPIGAFQAIQHLLAVLAEQAAAATMAAETACRAADRGAAAFEIAVAKIRAGDAAAHAASIAHEVHGAIGFTHEHALHFTTRRLWSWRPEFGAEPHWARQLGLDALARGADALWPSITARD